MKKLTYIFGIVALGLAVASCDDFNAAPTFDDANAFVEVGTASISVSEDCGEITIPVTLASLKGIEENVSYATVDGTAKAGTDFELVDGTATLKFNAENRTQNIKIKIINRAGEYTGDLKFTVELKSAGGVNLGMNKTCEVYITDNDHPLASILGAYTATDMSYGKAAQTWTCNITKDPDDVTVVHIDALINFCAGSKKFDMTGSVSEDLKTITVAAGQKATSYDTTPTDFFMLITWEDGIYVYDDSEIVLTQVEPGVWTCPDNIGFMSCESEKLYTNTIDRGPLTLVKK